MYCKNCCAIARGLGLGEVFRGSDVVVVASHCDERQLQHRGTHLVLPPGVLHRQQQQQQGGRGRGGRGAVAAQSPHWKDVVRSDDAGERPPWRLTCYAHERSRSNDLVGDVSFEELRWSQLQVTVKDPATCSSQVTGCCMLGFS